MAVKPTLSCTEFIGRFNAEATKGRIQTLTFKRAFKADGAEHLESKTFKNILLSI